MKSDYETDEELGVDYDDLITYDLFMESVKDMAISIVVITVLGAPIVYYTMRGL